MNEQLQAAFDKKFKDTWFFEDVPLNHNRHLLRFNIAWQILARQQFRDRIPYYWDEDIIFHHKTGMLDFVEHDGGILEADFGTYSIIIFASNLKSNAIGGREMGKLGQYIYNYLAQK